MNHNLQGSEAWHAYRRQHVNASEIAAIMGLDPWRSAIDVYREKVNGVTKDATEAMKAGTAMEPYARQAYEEYTGLAVEPIVRQHPDHPWLSASLDGTTFDRKYIVEIKCPGASSYEKMMKNGIPRNYWIQIQTQLACVPSASIAHFFVCLCNTKDGHVQIVDYFMESVERNQEFIDNELIPTCQRFWEENILKKIPPQSKYISINDEEYFRLEERLQKLIEIRKKIEQEEEEIKSSMVHMAAQREVEGNLTRICTQTRKGSYNEEKIKLLIDMTNCGITLDGLRNPATTYQSVTFIKRKDGS